MDDEMLVPNLQGNEYADAGGKRLKTSDSLVMGDSESLNQVDVEQNTLDGSQEVVSPLSSAVDVIENTELYLSTAEAVVPTPNEQMILCDNDTIEHVSYIDCENNETSGTLSSETVSMETNQSDTHLKETTQNVSLLSSPGSNLSECPVENDIKLDEPNVNVDPSNVNADPSNVKADPSNVNADPSNVNADSSNVNADPSNVNADPSNVNADPSNVNADPSNVNADPSNVNAGPSNVNADPSYVNADATNVNVDAISIPHSSKDFIDSTPSTEPPKQSSSVNMHSPKQATIETHKTEFSNYHLKWFDWKGEQTPIVTQNENGPCPLLAIANVLILARKINLPRMQQLISGKQLIEYIGDCILAETPKQEGNEELILNYEQNMQDAIDIMHKLQTGIDVNVKFFGVTDFEFTSECIVFDLLKIQLYHGWLIDPQDTVHVKAVSGLSYNQLVEKMLLSKEAEGDKVVEGMVIEEFLTRTASQLTYHGLCELNATIQEEELCVFFRNNHFSTLYKHKGELFLLVTDQGFLTEPAVVWETLINIEGDGNFVNSTFLSVTSQNESAKGFNENPAESVAMSQEDRDYLIALSLQQDVPSVHPSDDGVPKVPDLDSDHKLALKLQEDENRLAQQEHRQQQQQQPNLQQQQQQQMQQQQQVQQQQQQQQQMQQQQQIREQNIRSSQQTASRNHQQQDDMEQHQDRDRGCCIL